MLTEMMSLYFLEWLEELWDGGTCYFKLQATCTGSMIVLKEQWNTCLEFKMGIWCCELSIVSTIIVVLD